MASFGGGQGADGAEEESRLGVLTLGHRGLGIGIFDQYGSGGEI